MKNRWIVGTRKSDLALKQTQQVIEALKEYTPHIEIIVHEITTEGDQNLKDSLQDIGGKGVFVKEIEKQLLVKKIDFAVHSLKDVMPSLPKNLTIGCIPKRASPFDCLVTSKPFRRLADLPRGARIGTNSVRRQGQLLHLRPDLKIIPIRGNIDTRIKKISSDHLTGIILAEAGISRSKIDLSNLYQLTLKGDLLPAAGQGAIAIECRSSDQDTLQLIRKIEDPGTRQAVTIERQFLKALGGSCNYPIGAYADCKENEMIFSGMVASEDGKKLFLRKQVGTVEDGLGIATAEKLISMGALNLINN
ncbi:hydroxymethylbilane synthase [Lentilactobacillus raoultii]|uniref:Porphobilinogen deaminase n=1 Tax=Lentilactobacillus raoultii TaxID=1987503 RepID=A0ABW3PI61_9LACO